MKTLIDSTEDSATYKFEHENITRIVEFKYAKKLGFVEGDEEQEEQTKPDFEALSETEYQSWLQWLGIDE